MFICNRLQDTHGPLITRHRHNAETRDLGLKRHGVIPLDPTRRYALLVTCSVSAHVRRTLLTAVEYGGDTSHASLYFSCQCAGLDGNPVAICAVSRRMNSTSMVGVFFKRETAQIAKAVEGQAAGPLSDSSTKTLWAKSCCLCEAQTPSNLPARREAVSVFFNNGGE